MIFSPSYLYIANSVILEFLGLPPVVSTSTMTKFMVTKVSKNVEIVDLEKLKQIVLFE
jgi:hypothetical protein